jgi:hypothetical protein
MISLFHSFSSLYYTHTYMDNRVPRLLKMVELPVTVSDFRFA